VGAIGRGGEGRGGGGGGWGGGGREKEDREEKKKEPRTSPAAQRGPTATAPFLDGPYAVVIVGTGAVLRRQRSCGHRRTTRARVFADTKGRGAAVNVTCLGAGASRQPGEGMSSTLRRATTSGTMITEWRRGEEGGGSSRRCRMWVFLLRFFFRFSVLALRAFDKQGKERTAIFAGTRGRTGKG